MSPTSQPLNRPSPHIPVTGRGVLLCALAVLLSGLVYFNALHNPFVYDDHRLIEENQSLVDVLDIKAIVLHEITRPLVNFSYAVDRGAWGPSPFGFHVTNVLLHMINVGLLFVLAWRAMEDRRRGPKDGPRRSEVAAFSAAVLFAVHPMMTEAVGYISGRAELLCAMFVLMGLLAGREWMETRNYGWKVATGGCWVLGLLSKETAIIFPLLLACYGLIVRHDPPERRREDIAGFYAPFLLVTIFIGAIRLAVFFLLEHPANGGLQFRYVLVDLDVVTRYLSLLLVPNGQTIFHAIVPATSLTDPRALMAILTVGMLVVLLVVTRRNAPMASLGICWFLAVLVPSAALVVFNRSDPMAEHRVYLAAAGLFLTAGSAMSRMWIGFAAGPVRARLLLRIAAGAAVLSLSGRTLVRNVIWSDPVMLWSEAAEKAPNHWLPALVLGEALHDAGRHTEAVVSLNRAVRLNPDEPAAYSKLGVCLLEIHQPAAAEHVFLDLQRLDPRSAQASNGLGAVALARGEAASARAHFTQTLQFDSHNIEARRGLAIISESFDHNPREALKVCEEIRALDPDAAGVNDCISRNLASTPGGRPRP